MAEKSDDGMYVDTYGNKYVNESAADSVNADLAAGKGYTGPYGNNSDSSSSSSPGSSDSDTRSYGGSVQSSSEILSAADKQRHREIDAMAAARDKAGRAGMFEVYNQMIRDFNAGNWEKVLEASVFEDSGATYIRFNNNTLPDNYRGKTILILGIARAYRDNDYQAAFKAADNEKEAEQSEMLCAMAMTAVIKAWEKVNKRAMTEIDLFQFHIAYYEDLIKYYIGNSGNEYALKNRITEWESLTGKKFTTGLFGSEKKRIMQGNPYIGEASPSAKATFQRYLSAANATPAPAPSSAPAKGKLTFDNGDVYEGDIVNGNPHGKGKYTWQNGEIYEGDVADGKRHGKGKSTYANGEVYEGDFADDKRHGKGKYTAKAGWVYEGDYVDGKKQGKGKQIEPDGKVVEGDFFNAKIHGKAKMTFPSGRIYDGEWANGVPNGKGKQVWPDGKVENGNFKDGKFVG